MHMAVTGVGLICELGTPAGGGRVIMVVVYCPRKRDLI